MKIIISSENFCFILFFRISCDVPLQKFDRLVELRSERIVCTQKKKKKYNEIHRTIKIDDKI